MSEDIGRVWGRGVRELTGCVKSEGITYFMKPY